MPPNRSSNLGGKAIVPYFSGCDMSLAVRFGSFPFAAAFGGVTVSLALPVIPKLSQLIDLLPKQMSNESSVPADPRLRQLKELMERGGQPPFMIDNGMILKAVPKKKPSYKRTREKLYAPGHKQVQPLQNLGRCAACGRVKRSHFMCMHCFAEIRSFLKEKKKELFGESNPVQQDLDPVDERIIYPGHYVREREWRMKKKDWIPKREEPLMFDPNQVKWK